MGRRVRKSNRFIISSLLSLNPVLRRSCYRLVPVNLALLSLVHPPIVMRQWPILYCACQSLAAQTGGNLSLQHLLQLDRQRSQPLYQQIAEQIKTQISDGRLPIGTRLPTVRQLAITLGVTRLTVHSAYSELQSGGWVEATVG